MPRGAAGILGCGKCYLGATMSGRRLLMKRPGGMCRDRGQAHGRGGKMSWSSMPSAKTGRLGWRLPLIEQRGVAMLSRLSPLPSDRPSPATAGSFGPNRAASRSNSLSLSLSPKCCSITCSRRVETNPGYAISEPPLPIGLI